jgi:hypothetical protein
MTEDGREIVKPASTFHLSSGKMKHQGDLVNNIILTGVVTTRGANQDGCLLFDQSILFAVQE